MTRAGSERNGLGNNRITQKHWYGDAAEDINEYLICEFPEAGAMDIKPVICRSCGSDRLELKVDFDEDAIQVICPVCGQKKILLDCEEVWEDAEPHTRKCPKCKCKTYNVRVGFARRENGSVRWVYIGNRCTDCGLLGSYLNWKINYEPTDEMEQNL